MKEIKKDLNGLPQTLERKKQGRKSLKNNKTNRIQASHQGKSRGSGNNCEESKNEVQ